MKSHLIFAATIAACLSISACGAHKTSATGATGDAATVAGLPGEVEVGALRMVGIPEVPEDLKSKLNQYQNTRSSSFVDWHPSGDWMLISTRFGNTTQLHRVSQPMGARYQLTFEQEPVSSATFLNDGKTLVYGKDSGGNENTQYFRFDLESGTHTMFTDGKSRYGGLAVSRKSTFAAYSSNARNGTDTDVYVFDFVKRGSPRLLVKDGGSWWTSDISDDDRSLLVSNYISVTDNMIYLCDVDSGSLKPVIDVPQGTKAAVGDGAFSRSGDGAIYFTSDLNSEFSRLCRRNPKGEVEVLTQDIDWDVQSFALSDDGAWLAIAINAGGMTEVYLDDLKSGKRIQIPTDPGVTGGLTFHASNTKLAMTSNTPKSPGNILVYDIKSGKSTQWTDSEVGGLNPANFVLPERIEYRSFDGTKIDAWYYKPKGAGPFPVVVSFHGGPEGQSRPYFSTWDQYLINELGIAILKPNVRGSTGYGKTFVELDNAMKREDSVKDGGALLDWIASRRELNANRVAVTGGSYGGYMVLAMLTNYPDRIQAGICSVGISNFITFLENTSDYRRDLRRAEYGDERDPEMRAHFEKISPMNNASRIRSSLFLIHGYNDPRVPWTEAKQIAEILRKNNVPVWYLLAMNEGHGFAKKENRTAQEQAEALFLMENLLE
jgi:dipeptidyl aminopeptidase/acylaminoacyl peptidase